MTDRIRPGDIAQPTGWEFLENDPNLNTPVKRLRQVCDLANNGTKTIIAIELLHTSSLSRGQLFEILMSAQRKILHGSDALHAAKQLLDPTIAVADHDSIRLTPFGEEAAKAAQFCWEQFDALGKTPSDLLGHVARQRNLPEGGVSSTGLTRAQIILTLSARNATAAELAKAAKINPALVSSYHLQPLQMQGIIDYRSLDTAGRQKRGENPNLPKPGQSLAELTALGIIIASDILTPIFEWANNRDQKPIDGIEYPSEEFFQRIVRAHRSKSPFIGADTRRDESQIIGTVVSQDGQLNKAQIARAIGLTPSHGTKVVDRLIRSGRLDVGQNAESSARPTIWISPRRSA
ncbi:hypothetical protein HY024_00225 [Candidatus Curtissbacteria bacterium]|nr:hypothetical protein [Candidatus Curtissbacteria bacterium]